MKLFLQKNAKFSNAEGSTPRHPKQPPPIANFWLRAWFNVLDENSETQLLIEATWYPADEDGLC